MSYSSSPPPSPPKVNLLQLGLEFGFILSVPLLILISLGFILDKKYQTTPLFILIGLFLALVISSYALYQKIQAIFTDLNLINKKKVKK